MGSTTQSDDDDDDDDGEEEALKKTFEEACEQWWSQKVEEETMNNTTTTNSSIVVEWTSDEQYYAVHATAFDAATTGTLIEKRYCPCTLMMMRDESKWECHVPKVVTFEEEERKKGGGPLNAPIILIITLIMLTCVWTFQLWKKKMENRRRDVRESEELEESVRMENEIKFRKQDGMYEHWKSCVQPDGTKVICVEIERKKKRMADENNDLVIPLDANGNVVIAISNSESSYNSSSLDVLPPRVPPVVRARPSVLQRQHLSSDEEGEREEEREFGHDIEAARGVTEFPELQNHGPEHTVGRRRRRNDSYSSVTFPTGSDVQRDEIVHDGANPSNTQNGEESL
jgi:hypothetical protein